MLMTNDRQKYREPSISRKVGAMKFEKIAFVEFAILSVFCFSVYAGEYPDYTRADYPLTSRAKFIYTGLENSDTRPDVIVVGWSGVISVYLSGTVAVFGSPIITKTGISNPNLSVADDFNNDGLTDICINDTLFVATGDGGFTTAKPLGIENLQTLAAADMNGDGEKDLIAIAIINTSPGMRAAELRTYFGNGDGTFQEPVKTGIVFTIGEINWEPDTGRLIDDSGEYDILYIGDLTSDGIPDLVVYHFLNIFGNTFYFNRTYTGSINGTFTKNSLYAPGNNQLVGVFDFNGDGMLDIMSSGSRSAVLYIGNNRGQFDYSREIDPNSPEMGLGSPSRIFSVTDMNGDGILDIAAIHGIGDSSQLVAIPWKNNIIYSKIHQFPVVLPNNVWGYGGYYLPGLGGITSCNLNNDRYADFLIPGDTFFSVVLSSSPSRINTLNEISSTFFIGQNIPNPFNAYTTIPYTIVLPGYYELSIYDIFGRKIKTLCRGFQTKGSYRNIWDGRDKNGAELASGFYFSILKQMERKEEFQTKKILLIK
ncbi:MAG: FG-GAP-like repeat-containing protein [Candidatus Latescibacter sp.]|nr:FG-GAP-like repeat-containing protein [Candidatus Latescibacter sp.]